ncbi:MAG: polysaccharide biosynthesis tyrosine autokinase [Pseudomonadota bacterium]
MKSPLNTNLGIRQDEEEGVLDLMVIARSLWVRKWSILSLATLMAILQAFWVSSKPSIYDARATLVIEQGENNVVSIQDVYTQDYGSWEYMQTQFELLRSRSLAERVVRKLELHRLERFRPQPPPPRPWYKPDLSKLKPAGFNPVPEQPWVMPSENQQIQNLTAMVAGQVQVRQIGDSNVVALTYRADDPQLAASIANTYLQEYIDSFHDAKEDATRQATEYLNARMEDLRQALKDSEDRLQTFRDQEKLVDIEGVTTLSTQEISSLNSTYSQSRQRRLELETTQRELERVKNASVEEMMMIPSVLNHIVVRDLKQKETEAESNVSELSRRYGPKHPKMIDAMSQLNSAKSALESEVRNVVFGIGREYEIALTNEMSSKTQLDTTKLDLQDLNRKEFMLKELEREVGTNSQLYDIFFTRIKETSDAGLFEPSPARIVDLSEGGSKVGPNVKQAAIMAFAFTVAIASGLSLVLDTINNTIKSPIDVEEKLRAPLLGTLPLIKESKEGDFEDYWKDPKSEFAESVRTIRTGVVLSGLDSPSKIIVITSSVPGEGKSTLALNLAAAFAQMEKTLVIGADLRRPSLARKCKLPAKHPGLSNYVAGSATLDECIATLPGTTLSVMPAGIIPSNPLEMLSSLKFREALESLKTRFDRIVIDSAPIQAVSDALMLASYADSLIFVVKSDATAVSLVKKSLTRLLDANDLLTGVVLNHFEPSKSAKYYGSYNYRYSESYYNSTDTHG